MDTRSLWADAVEANDKGHVATALVLLERYAGAKPDSKRANILRAEILVGMCRFDEAEVVLRLVGTPERADLSHWLFKVHASLCMEQCRYAEAVAWYRKLADLDPSSTAPKILMGSALAKAGRLDEAEAAHRDATVLQGDVDEAFLNLGLVLRAQSRLPEARDALMQALALTPGYVEALAALDDVNRAIELG